MFGKSEFAIGGGGLENGHTVTANIMAAIIWEAKSGAKLEEK